MIPNDSTIGYKNLSELCTVLIIVSLRENECYAVLASTRTHLTNDDMKNRKKSLKETTRQPNENTTIGTTSSSSTSASAGLPNLSILDQFEGWCGSILFPSDSLLRSKVPTHADSLIAFRNCLYMALFVVVSAFIARNFPTWFHLHSGLIRPRMDVNETRQVVIYGLQGSGTVDVSKKLNNLGIEMGHETSNSRKTFCRDGSIGWLHGIHGLMEDNFSANVQPFCESNRPPYKVFHPMLFSSSACSSFSLGPNKDWNACWKQACKDTIRLHYGCLDSNSSICVPQFKRRLLQVRHPLKNIASNIVKYCDRSDFNSPHSRVNTDIYNALLTFLPNIDWRQNQNCIFLLAKYWLEYNRRLVQHVHAWYQVETTSPCKVAQLAGFMDPQRQDLDHYTRHNHQKQQLLPYAPTVRSVLATCRPADLEPTQFTQHGVHHLVNKGRIVVTFEDIERVDIQLGKDVKEMARFFGYSDKHENELMSN